METGPLTNDAAAAAARAAAEAARRAAEEAAARAAAEAARAAAEDNAPPEPSGAIDLPPVDEIQKGKGFDDPFEMGDEGEADFMTLAAPAEAAPNATPAANKATAPAADKASTPVAVPKSSYDAAGDYQAIDAAYAEMKVVKEEHDKAERELASVLAQVGPGVTEAQQAQIRDKFWADRAGLTERLEQAQAKFAPVLEKHMGAIAANYAEALASGNADDLADFQAQFDDYMAGTGKAAGDLAMRFAATVMAQPGVQNDGKLAEKVMASVVMPHMAAGIAGRVEAGESVQNVYADVKANLSAVFNGNKGQKMFQDAFDVLNKLEDAESLPAALKANRMAGILREYPNTGVARSLAVIGVVGGALGLGEAAANGDWAAVVKEAVGTAKDGADLLGTFDKFKGALGTGTKYAKVAGPLLGYVTSGIAYAQALGKFAGAEEKDARVLGIAAAHFLAASGYAWAAAAGVAGLSTGGIGLAVAGVAGVVAAGLELWVEKSERDRALAANKGLIGQFVQPPDFVAMLLENAPQHNQRLTDIGLSPEQVQALYAQGFKETLLSSKSNQAYAIVEDLATLSGRTQGDKLHVYSMMQDLRTQYPDENRRRPAMGELQVALQKVLTASKEHEGKHSTTWWRQQFQDLAEMRPPHFHVDRDPNFANVAARAGFLYRAMPEQPSATT